MSSAPGSPSAPRLSGTGISEVRYSLPQLLQEVQQERKTAAFVMEKLDQVEIAKLFKNRPRRAKSGK